MGFLNLPTKLSQQVYSILLLQPTAIAMHSAIAKLNYVHGLLC